MALYTREQWQSLIEQYESSGLSQAEFCKRHNLNPKYFSLKRSKLRPKDQPSSPFIRAARISEPRLNSGIELQFGAVKLKLSDSVTSAYLVDLIRALA